MSSQRDEELEEYRRAVEEDPRDPDAWAMLAYHLGEKAREQSDFHRELELRQQEVSAYRKALSLESGDPVAWTNFGLPVDEPADQEPDPIRRPQLHEPATAA